VLGTNVFVVEPLSFLVGQLHDFASAVSKSFVHLNPSFQVQRWKRTVRSTPKRAGVQLAAKNRSNIPYVESVVVTDALGYLRNAAQGTYIQQNAFRKQHCQNFFIAT
jgi:hypothetical protein